MYWLLFRLRIIPEGTVFVTNDDFSNNLDVGINLGKMKVPDISSNFRIQIFYVLSPRDFNIQINFKYQILPKLLRYSVYHYVRARRCSTSLINPMTYSRKMQKLVYSKFLDNLFLSVAQYLLLGILFWLTTVESRRRTTITARLCTTKSQCVWPNTCSMNYGPLESCSLRYLIQLWKAPK